MRNAYMYLYAHNIYRTINLQRVWEYGLELVTKRNLAEMHFCFQASRTRLKPIEKLQVQYILFCFSIFQYLFYFHHQ